MENSSFTKDGITYKVIRPAEDDLSLSNLDSFRNKVEAHTQLPNSNIALDMSEINTITSAGLGVLIGINSKVSSKDGKFCLINVDERIIKIFEITKLHTIFKIY